MEQTIQGIQDESTNKLADVEQVLKMREKELSELKDAYKEKYRKCSAWEKVSFSYVSLYSSNTDFYVILHTVLRELLCFLY